MPGFRVPPLNAPVRPFSSRLSLLKPAPPRAPADTQSRYSRESSRHTSALGALAITASRSPFTALLNHNQHDTSSSARGMKCTHFATAIGIALAICTFIGVHLSIWVATFAEEVTFDIWIHRYNDRQCDIEKQGKKALVEDGKSAIPSIEASAASSTSGRLSRQDPQCARPVHGLRHPGLGG